MGTQEVEGGLGLQKALRGSRGPQAKLTLLGVLRPKEPRKGKKQCDSQALPLLAISGVAVQGQQHRAGSPDTHPHTWSLVRFRCPEACQSWGALFQH